MTAEAGTATPAAAHSLDLAAGEIAGARRPGSGGSAMRIDAEPRGAGRPPARSADLAGDGRVPAGDVDLGRHAVRPAAAAPSRRPSAASSNSPSMAMRNSGAARRRSRCRRAWRCAPAPARRPAPCTSVLAIWMLDVLLLRVDDGELRLRGLQRAFRPIPAWPWRCRMR